jgi:hypothetical protein
MCSVRKRRIVQRVALKIAASTPAKTNQRSSARRDRPLLKLFERFARGLGDRSKVDRLRRHIRQRHIRARLQPSTAHRLSKIRRDATLVEKGIGPFLRPVAQQ